MRKFCSLEDYIETKMANKLLKKSLQSLTYLTKNGHMVQNLTEVEKNLQAAA